MNRVLIILGTTLIVAGLTWPWLRRMPLFHLPGDPPVKGRRVDHDGKVGFAPVSFCDQVAIEAEDLGQAAENLSDPDNCKVFSVNDCVAACRAHSVATDAEECERLVTVP